MTTLRRTMTADPGTVFRILHDIDRLPEWNGAITHVVERPPALVPGSEWVVEMRALGQTWHSRSRLELLDPERRRFGYRSQTDDGNPSYAEWTWTVSPHGEGSEVVVSWKLNPQTFWRRVLLARIRARQLKKGELPASLSTLERLAEEASAGVE